MRTFLFPQIRPALTAFLFFTVATGFLYPLFVTVSAQICFPAQANGSRIERGGHVVGSDLIGQSFQSPEYFWGRPSATTPYPYNATASSGSNLGPTNPDLAKAVAERIRILKESDPGNTEPIPMDLVTSSGSGLDPHISPQAARWQIARVARARGVDAEEVRRLVEAHAEGRSWGIFGDPRVNVLRLNMALDILLNK